MDAAEGGRLGDLYRQHVRGLVQLAYIVTGDAQLAEDLAQEAFVRMAGRFARLRDPEAAGFYLRRTLMNLCKNHFRRNSSEKRFLRLQPRTYDSSEFESTTDTREDLRSAVQRLPERQRAALALRYFEDCSVEETAQIMRCPTGTVKALTSRGIDALNAAADLRNSPLSITEIPQLSGWVAGRVSG